MTSSSVSLYGGRIDGGIINTTNAGLSSFDGTIEDALLRNDLTLTGRILNLSGTIVIDGTLRVSRDGRTGAEIHAPEDGSVVLTGNGELFLDETGALNSHLGSISTYSPARSTIVSDGFLIRGQGRVYRTHMINRGEIRSGAGLGHRDRGHHEGIVTIESGKEIRFGGSAAIEGGSIHGEPGSIIIPSHFYNTSGGSLRDVAITGEITTGQLASTPLFVNGLVLAGEIENNATIRTFDRTNEGENAAWMLATGEELSLSGHGTLSLSADAHRATFYGRSIKNGKDHTIRGSGRIADASIENSGLIAAESGDLILENLKLTGSGSLGVKDGARLVVQGEESDLFIQNIKVESNGQFVIEAGRVEFGDVAVSVLNSGGVIEAGARVRQPQISGTIQNQSTLRVFASTENTGLDRTPLSIDGTLNLTGTVEVAIAADLLRTGLDAGFRLTALSVSNPVLTGPEGLLSRVVVDRDGVQALGALAAYLLEPLPVAPPCGGRHCPPPPPVPEFRAFVPGVFQTVLTEKGTAIAVELRRSLLPHCSPADVDGNGTIDVHDLIEFLSAFQGASDCPDSVPCAVANIDRDGDVDVFDLIAFLSHFDPAGSDCGS